MAEVQSLKNRRAFQLKKLEVELNEATEFLKSQPEDLHKVEAKRFKDFSYTLSSRMKSYQTAHSALSAKSTSEELIQLEDEALELLDSAETVQRKLDQCVEEISEYLKQEAEMTEKRKSEEKAEQIRLEEKLEKEKNLQVQLDKEGNDRREREIERQLQAEKERLDRELQIELEKLRLKSVEPDQSKKDDTEETQVTKQKLPELKIPTFDGNRLKWLEFWEIFEATIGKMKITQREKLGRLKSYLVKDSEAERCIGGLTITGDNYEIAVKRLHERFGNKNDIVKDHMEKIQKLILHGTSFKELRVFWDLFEIHIEQMEALGEKFDDNILALNLIQSKLPTGVLIRLNELNHNADLSFRDIRRLMKEYLKSRDFAIQDNYQLEKPVVSNSQISNRPEKFFSRPNPIKSTVSTLVAVNKPEQRAVKCFYCGENHWSDECNRFPDFESRKNQLGNRCFKCLQQGHSCQKCPNKEKTCFNCKKNVRHHRSLCQTLFGQSSSTDLKISDSANTVELEAKQNKQRVSSSVLYPTAWVRVRNPSEKQSIAVRMLIDSGSSKNYITEAMAKTLQLETEFLGVTPVFTFGSDSAKNINSSGAELEIQLADESWLKFPVKVVPKVTGTVYEAPESVSFMLLSYRNCTLADNVPESEKHKPIDLLVGMESYHEILQREKYWQVLRVSPGLNLENSALGWILSGKVPMELNLNSKEAVGLVSFRQEHDAVMVCTERSQTIDELRVEFKAPDESERVSPSLEDLFNLEALGITDSPYITDNDRAVENFKKTINFDPAESRYYVTWAYKSEAPELPENKDLALGRLRSLLRRLSQDSALLKKYDGIIKEQESKGIIEKVNDMPRNKPVNHLCHYIPHQAVITPQKETTKVRIVYDASAKTKKSVLSLNEVLLQGQDLLANLVGMLLRFRERNVAVAADIEKAFLQVGLQENDRDVTRFFWIKDTENPQILPENIQIYRFCRVPFGIISSPFLLMATVLHHLDKNPSAASDLIKPNIYMDNVLIGVDSVDEGVAFYREAKQIFQSASMNLREWTTNEEKLAEMIPEQDRAKGNRVKALGLTWDLQEDTLVVAGSEKLDALMIKTRRDLLKSAGMVFDPLGMFAPVSLKLKKLMRQLVLNKKNDSDTAKLGWDEQLSEEIIQNWKDLLKDMKEIANVKIKRWLGLTRDTRYKLICFTDASKDAYGAVAYLRIESEKEANVQLLFAKSRLTPIKEMTIPRLELLGVLVGIRMLTFLEDQLKLPIKEKVLWTDSQCVLNWLKSAKDLGTFIENRVREIRNKANQTEFRYISTDDNPADMVSRGCSVSELQNSIWWTGPNWLKHPETQWPTHEVPPLTSALWQQSNEKKSNQRITFCESKASLQGRISFKDQAEKLSEAEISLSVGRSLKAKHVILEMKGPFGLDEKHFSSMQSLLKRTAWLNRVISRMKKVKIPQGNITAEEYQKARLQWDLHVQKKYFHGELSLLNENKQNDFIRELGLQINPSTGLLQCHGRLQNADLDEKAKFPVLLPGKDFYTRLVIEEKHVELQHSGTSHTLAQVRMNYWIPKGRSVVKSVLRQCLVCKRIDGGPFKVPVMPSWPEFRVSPSPPFTFTGVDYMGPLLVKNSINELKKVWICLFTCLVTRAVHLELAEDMSGDEFLMVLRRFMARRGKPRQILSDNAQQFKVTEKVLRKAENLQQKQNEIWQDYLSKEKVCWKFIPELSPWMGGVYERLVGSVKKCLKKVIGRMSLHQRQLKKKKKKKKKKLETLLQETEAIVNSRPLVYVGSDLGDLPVITPGHFLSLNQKTIPPFVEDDDDPNDDDFHLQRIGKADTILKNWKKGQRQLDTFWKLWKSDYLLSLRERKQVDLKHPRIQHGQLPRVGEIVSISENQPRSTWAIGRIQELIHGSDDEIRVAKVKLSNGHILIRALKMLYPLECSVEVEGKENMTESDEENPDTKVEIELAKPEVVIKNRRQAFRKAENQIREHFSSGSVATFEQEREI